MEQLNFGIVIPIYNVAPYLRECLESVLNQTHQNLQIVCVDDGSTDESFAIAYEFFLRDSRFSIIRKANGGLSQARNVGVDYLMAKGPFQKEKVALESLRENEEKFHTTPPPTVLEEYQIFCHQAPFYPDCLHFVDSDDFLELHCIEQCAKVFSRFEEVDVVWHSYDCLYEIDNRREKGGFVTFEGDFGTPMRVPKMLDLMSCKHLNFGWHGALRAKVIDQIRFIDKIEFEDVGFAFMLFANARFVVVLEEALLCYRIREGSIFNYSLHNPSKQNYPSYMVDLKTIFNDFRKAKAYYWFYSDCCNVLEAERYFASLENPDFEVLQRLRDLLKWRVLHYLTLEMFRIDRTKDPRDCLGLYKKIVELGLEAKPYRIVLSRIRYGLHKIKERFERYMNVLCSRE